MTHLDDLRDQYNAATAASHESLGTVRNLAVPFLVASVTAEVPDAVTIKIETSDQGEWMTLTTVIDSSGDEHDDVADNDDVSNILMWMTWSDVNGFAHSVPGWEVLNKKGGYHQINVAAYLAATVTP